MYLTMGLVLFYVVFSLGSPITMDIFSKRESVNNVNVNHIKKEKGFEFFGDLIFGLLNDIIDFNFDLRAVLTATTTIHECEFKSGALSPIPSQTAAPLDTQTYDNGMLVKGNEFDILKETISNNINNEVSFIQKKKRYVIMVYHIYQHQ